MRLPLISFVDAPPDIRRERGQIRGWVAFIIGALNQRPGEWAHIVFDDGRVVNVSNVQSTCKLLEVKADAVIRNGDLYMRLIP
jgi:hypothetical protein